MSDHEEGRVMTEPAADPGAAAGERIGREAHAFGIRTLVVVFRGMGRGTA